jgi:hypothetical protein
MVLFTFDYSRFIRRDRFVPILLETSFWHGERKCTDEIAAVRLPDAMDRTAADALRPRQPQGKDS